VADLARGSPVKRLFVRHPWVLTYAPPPSNQRRGLRAAEERTPSPVTLTPLKMVTPAIRTSAARPFATMIAPVCPVAVQLEPPPGPASVGLRQSG